MRTVLTQTKPTLKIRKINMVESLTIIVLTVMNLLLESQKIL